MDIPNDICSCDVSSMVILCKVGLFRHMWCCVLHNTATVMATLIFRPFTIHSIPSSMRYWSTASKCILAATTTWRCHIAWAIGRRPSSLKKITPVKYTNPPSFSSSRPDKSVWKLICSNNVILRIVALKFYYILYTFKEFV